MCTGIDNCVVIAETVFKLDKDKKAIVLDAGSVAEKTLMDAAESCPAQAIILEDEQGNQVYP